MAFHPTAAAPERKPIKFGGQTPIYSTAINLGGCPHVHTRPRRSVRSVMTSQQNPQTASLLLWRARETAMTSQLSPPAVSREVIARRVAARMRQKGIVLPDTEEWVEARREPLRRVVVTIRARFEGPKVRGMACRLHR